MIRVKFWHLFLVVGLALVLTAGICMSQEPAAEQPAAEEPAAEEPAAQVLGPERGSPEAIALV